MGTPSAISTIGLTKHYGGIAALTDLTLEVPTGSIYGFLGPNGAGKTTALKLLAGLTQPTRGTASVTGIPVRAGSAYRQAVGYLGQEPRFYGWMTGRETIEYIGSLYPRAVRPDKARVQEVIDLVGLSNAAGRLEKTYSGGMRQRLGIAQALVARPAVLLLDEPVSALDPIGRRDIFDLMKALKGEVTVFYSTHILEDVERVADYVAILAAGRLVRAEATAELLASFSPNRMHVVLGFATSETSGELAAVPGVHTVAATGSGSASITYALTVEPHLIPSIQRAITRLAADTGLTVIDNAVVREGLEDVFMRLVDGMERAA